MKTEVISLMVVSVLALADPAGAGLMAIWDFGPSSAYYTEAATTEYVAGAPTLTLLGGEKDANGKNGVDYTDVDGLYHVAGQAAAWDDVKVSGDDAEWTIGIDTTGWYDMAIRFDYKSAETPSFDFDYRFGAGDWQEILNNHVITVDWDNWHSFSYDLSSISDIENQSVVEFRFYDLDRDGNKKFAFDNLEITGVPEPATITLLAAGTLGLLGKRRYNRR